jgi:hypothetical protein
MANISGTKPLVSWQQFGWAKHPLKKTVKLSIMESTAIWLSWMLGSGMDLF